MNASQILKLLAHLKAKHVMHRGKWVQASCPLAPWNHDSGKDSQPSFAVRVEDNKASFFNCFVCQHGSMSDLLLELQHQKAQNLGYDLAAAWVICEEEEAQKLSTDIKDWGAQESPEAEYVIPDWWADTFPKAWPVPYARDYLESRMVNESIAERCDIRWDRSKRTVCFPVRNRAGELVSMRGRRIDPQGAPPYHVYTPSGTTVVQSWLGEHWVDFDRPVLMVESVFDLTSALRVYENVVAPLSVGINAARMKRMAGASEVVTLFDQGVGGDKARAIVKKHLGSAFVVHCMPTQKDPGEMSAVELHAVLGAALKLKPLL